MYRLCPHWTREVTRHKYRTTFHDGQAHYQTPQDMVAMQEIIWRVKPDLIIETGIAHGGSLIYYASLLEMIGGDGYVLGIDVDILEHNRVEMKSTRCSSAIKMIQDHR